MVASGDAGGGAAATAAAGPALGLGWRRRQAAWRQASEHQRRRPAGVNGWPQAGHAAVVSLRPSLRDGVWAGGWRGGVRVTGLLLLSGCRGDAAQVTVLEPVGIAFERDDLGVVDEPVDHRGGDDV